MPVLLVFSYTCELDPTTSARVRRCSSLVHSLVPWAGNDMFRHRVNTNVGCIIYTMYIERREGKTNPHSRNHQHYQHGDILLVSLLVLSRGYS